MPALRNIGNIAAGNESQTQTIINACVLPRLLALLTHSKRGIRKESCWTISNITARSSDQIQAVIDADIFPPLIGLLNSNDEYVIRKEAAWAVSNAISNGTPAQIQYLVHCGCLRPLCRFLTVQGIRTFYAALEGVENILRLGDEIRLQNHLEVNPYIEQVRLAEGLSKLEALQNHTDNEIRNRAQSILETCNNRGDLNDSDSNKNTSDN
eukprot:c13129_g1_i3.p1 GENE.c13129_g1_i3~~c13129_g1_i3.p1  ORF type:complete len:210 (-),score=53.49 c13129_g1_i3:157-786(-)